MQSSPNLLMKQVKENAPGVFTAGSIATDSILKKLTAAFQPGATFFHTLLLWQLPFPR